MNERLDRQLRIEGWNQDAIDKAKIGVCGDLDSLASQYVLSSSALGFKEIVVIAPALDERLVETAKSINPELNLTQIEGHYTHPRLDDNFDGCDLIADLTQYNLANKLLISMGFNEDIPIIRGSSTDEGFDIFTYKKGREWQDLERVISSSALPKAHPNDPVLDTIASGIILEETKNIVMGHNPSDEVISHKRDAIAGLDKNKRILVVGAGALGNFAGLCLGYSGYKNITIMDPDVAELTNLNRQVFLYDGVDKSKAKTLSRRLNQFFGIKTKAKAEYFRENTKIRKFDAIFDCVDNFETRILLSERCKKEGTTLVSGGTNVDAGQVIVYNPKIDDKTPAEFLGLYEIIGERKAHEYQRVRASCTYRPDPSVIMTNQIIAGFMVDAYNRMNSGQKVENIFYDSRSARRI